MRRIILLACFFLAGCQTTDPVGNPPDPTDRAEEISFDGAEQNAGLVGVLPDGWFHVTHTFRSRFVSLAAEYGRRISQPIVPPENVDGWRIRADGTGWDVDPQRMVAMLDMVAMSRRGAVGGMIFNSAPPSLENLDEVRNFLR